MDNSMSAKVALEEYCLNDFIISCTNDEAEKKRLLERNSNLVVTIQAAGYTIPTAC